jgi:hypothetical protein
MEWRRRANLSSDEGKTGLGDGLGEELALGGEAGDHDVVRRQEAGHGARTVLDLEVGAVGLVGRRLAVIVLVVQIYTFWLFVDTTTTSVSQRHARNSSRIVR